MKGLLRFKKKSKILISACSMLLVFALLALEVSEITIDQKVKAATTNQTETTTSGETIATLTNTSVDGTTGTPLGGFGTGGIKFCATNGTFAATTMAPAYAYNYKNMGATKFQFFSDNEGKIKTVETMTAKLEKGRYSDDAIWPEHLVNFGTINDIQVDLKAFSPLDNVNYDNMSMPYAFYEVTLKNNAASKVTAACAFQLDMGTGKASYKKDKGIQSKNWSLYAKSNDTGAVITAGSNDSFFKNGICDNSPKGSKNKVAVKVDLAANEEKTIQFVLAWYDDSDPESAYYLGLYKESGSIADLGLKNFDLLKKNADTLVHNMRSSNLPDWLKNQTLNTLCNLSNNSIYKKDGRVAFAEGEFNCYGTMDQMWHSRQIIAQLVPYYAWQELRYWARTQMSDPKGQIHHDFSTNANLCGWDDKQHIDYRNIVKWVDLNAGFIVSAYETYQITNDKEQIDYLWPYMKKAAQRILDQVKLYGNKKYPYTFDTSENSYDAGGDPNPFNASISAVTYKVMTLLAKEKGETNIVDTYDKAYKTVVASYRARYLNNNFPVKRLCESFFAGQWLSMNLKLGEIWTDSETDYVLDKLNSYYYPSYRGMGYVSGTYDEWTPYLLMHYGGLLLNTRRVNEWRAMQFDAYQRQYLNRNKVFNHPLDILPAITKTNYIATDTSGTSQYISMPGLWRNYYDLIGYHRDLRTNEIWIEPVILDEMKHQMKDAMFISPEGYGSISCTESGTYNQNKDIIIKTDHPTKVSSIHLTDNFGGNIKVTINDTNCEFTRIGEGYAKELLVKWDGTIDNKGIHIITSGDAGSAPPSAPKAPANNDNIPKEISDRRAVDKTEAEDFTSQAGIEISNESNNKYITSCNNFDYIKFDNIGFNNSETTFVAKVSSKIAGSKIEVILDSVSGKQIGTCTVPNTGGDQKWVEVTCKVTKTTGNHNVILRFNGSSNDNLLNMDWFQFKPDVFSKLEAENFTSMSGIQVEACTDSNGGEDVGYIESNDYIMFSALDFYKAPKGINVRVASDTDGGTMEIRLDSTRGKLIGKVKVKNTGGWQNWTTVSTKLKKTTGKHDVYLVFTDGNDYLFNLNWIKFK